MHSSFLHTKLHLTYRAEQAHQAPSYLQSRASKHNITAMAASSSPRNHSKSPIPDPSHFASIQEDGEEEETEGVKKHTETPEIKGSNRRHSNSNSTRYEITPLHPETTDKSASMNDKTVSYSKCRPNNREKISTVSVDINGLKQPNDSNISANANKFKSLFLSLTGRSPKSGDSSTREEQWRITIAELTQKLLEASRKRDEALLEVTRLKSSMGELERKLSKLEVHCYDLKVALEACGSSSATELKSRDYWNRDLPKEMESEKLVESFIRSVSDARTAVRQLSRSLTVQLRQTGGKVFEKLGSLLQPYDVRISPKNPRGLLFYLESLLNEVLYEDFELPGFQKSGTDSILNPAEKCRVNFSSFTILHDLSWEEVLTKGTKHFSESFSRFCDQKMSGIVSMLNWNKAWPEPLLQAFFSAAKHVWLVHLLASAFHPRLPIFRVEKGFGFDGFYMEDMVGDKMRKEVALTVRMMVAPGFYVHGSVVKCKVLCEYREDQHNLLRLQSV